MDNIKDYKVIQDKDVKSVTKKVIEAIKDGWQPIGGISVYETEVRKQEGIYVATIWFQTMVNYHETIKVGEH